MDNAQCTKIIDDLRFMPGWSFQAMPFDDGTIMAFALIDTVNSDHDQAVMGYPQKITLERGVLINPGAYATSDEFAAALFTWITEIMIHETREFLRLGSEDLRAPFHPHRPEGEAMWAAKIINTPSDPMRGMLVLNV